MQHRSALSVLFGFGTAAFLALPIALTSYVATRSATVTLPSFHATHSGPDWAVDPISDLKARAVHDFKTGQM